MYRISVPWLFALGHGDVYICGRYVYLIFLFPYRSSAPPPLPASYDPRSRIAGPQGTNASHGSPSDTRSPTRPRECAIRPQAATSVPAQRRPHPALIRTHLEMHVEPRNPTVFHTAQRGSPMTRNKGSCIRGLQFPRIPNAVPVSLYANPSPPYLRPGLIYIAPSFSIAFILLTTGGELRERLRTEGARIGKIASHR